MHVVYDEFERQRSIQRAHCAHVLRLNRLRLVRAVDRKEEEKKSKQMIER